MRPNHRSSRTPIAILDSLLLFLEIDVEKIFGRNLITHFFAQFFFLHEILDIFTLIFFTRKVCRKSQKISCRKKGVYKNVCRISKPNFLEQNFAKCLVENRDFWETNLVSVDWHTDGILRNVCHQKRSCCFLKVNMKFRNLGISHFSRLSFFL